MTTDWDPEAYARFRGLRLRPALDLLAQVGALPAGDVVDLGCGNGAVGAVLRARFAGRRLAGVDASPAMLAEAAATGAYDALMAADIAGWVPDRPAALVFSNAALHWLGDHAALLPRLAGGLAPGGVLAVQMPGQHDAPSHRLLRDTAAQFGAQFGARGDAPSPVAAPADYHAMLSPLGRVTVWETTYLQQLARSDGLHPVAEFMQSTAMRPALAAIAPADHAAFLAALDAGLRRAYPLLPDGSVLFPFRRVFFVLEV